MPLITADARALLAPKSRFAFQLGLDTPFEPIPPLALPDGRRVTVQLDEIKAPMNLVRTKSGVSSEAKINETSVTVTVTGTPNDTLTGRPVYGQKATKQNVFSCSNS